LDIVSCKKLAIKATLLQEIVNTGFASAAGSSDLSLFKIHYKEFIA